jgi:aldose sugar dehydrogenase
MTRIPRLLGASCLSLGIVVPASAQTTPVNTFFYQLQVEPIVEGLEHPWAMVQLPDGSFLVTERNAGNLRIGSPDGTLSEPLEGMPEVFHYEGETERSQGGLFDVKLDPDYQTNGAIYISYAKPTERGAAVAIDRVLLRVEDGETVIASREAVFEMNEEDQDSSGLHFGGRMAIHPEDGTIFLAIGDRRNISRSQDGEDQAGSVLRMTGDGAAPDDNPFVDDDEVDDYIYSMGHRNPQGLAFDPETGNLWLNEHGPEGGDEVNLIEAGNNYGWPFITGGVDYSGAPLGVGLEMEGMTSAMHIFEDTVAPSGLAFVTGDMFDAWQGDVLHGGLITEGIVRMRLENTTVADVETIEIGRRVRDVMMADDGSIWVLTDHEDGEILRLIPGDQ